jgi:NAD(P)-dependent dehydrogenase (short-subunit alcohol dehydrogenase family)
MGSSERTFLVRAVAVSVQTMMANKPNCSPIGHFYLTELLLPTLIATAEDSPPGVVRIVNVSSIAHNFGIPPEGINWDTVGPNADMAKRKEAGTMNLYSQSKLVSPFTLPVQTSTYASTTGERPRHE